MNKIALFFSIFLVLSPLAFDKQAMGQSLNSSVVSDLSFNSDSEDLKARKNPGVFELAQPELYDRVLVLSDVHGMYPQLLTLLKAAKLITNDGGQVLWTKSKTLLLVLGDSIDKGPQSIEVLDLWMNLQAQAANSQGRVVHLLGNHEAEFLADPSNKKASVFLDELKAKKISVNEYIDPTYPRAQFLRSLPLAAKVGSWLFAHSGFYPDMKWSKFKDKLSSLLSSGDFSDDLITGSDSILEAKKWEIDSKLKKTLESRLTDIGTVGVVFGHQPSALGIEGQCGVSSDRRLIKIDNGMAPEAGSHAGSILQFSNPSELNGNDTKQLYKMNVNAILPTGETRDLSSQTL